MVLDAVCLVEGSGSAMQSVKPPTQPEDRARPGLLLTWGASTAFWNSVSLLDKKLAVVSGATPCAVARAWVQEIHSPACPTESQVFGKMGTLLQPPRKWG